MNLLEQSLAAWSFTRSETLELLHALADEQLAYKPEGPTWQSIGHQFGCIGRTQIVYTRAIEAGNLDFSLFSSDELPYKDDYLTVDKLHSLLEQTDQAWLASIQKHEMNYAIEWPDGPHSLLRQIASLAEHERLHHGQLLAYFTLAGISLPPTLKANWAL